MPKRAKALRGGREDASCVLSGCSAVSSFQKFPSLCPLYPQAFPAVFLRLSQVHGNQDTSGPQDKCGWGSCGVFGAGGRLEIALETALEYRQEDLRMHKPDQDPWPFGWLSGCAHPSASRRTAGMHKGPRFRTRQIDPQGGQAGPGSCPSPREGTEGAGGLRSGCTSTEPSPLRPSSASPSAATVTTMLIR